MFVLLSCIPVLAQPVAFPPDELMTLGRAWSRESPALEMAKACRLRDVQPAKGELVPWFELLDANVRLKVVSDLSSEIHTREIALVCIEDQTGEAFYPFDGGREPTREIVSATTHGELPRFQITAINPKDIPRLKRGFSSGLMPIARRESSRLGDFPSDSFPAYCALRADNAEATLDLIGR